ncbi:MAG: DUF5698 domain-containing protein [Candidatus Uhrbacteria bacterium]|nr:DUF5698 domain-containing protein [Candidatus Uhrbacteria bacterium]
MMLFFIGLVEMVIATTWTRFVSRGQLFASSFITFVNILIWYYVLRQIISDLGDWSIIVLYAAGCATGTLLAMYFLDRNPLKE